MTTPSSTLRGTCKLSGPQLPDELIHHTFVVSNDTSGDLYFAARFYITCGGLQEKERLLWYFIAQLPRMICIVPANSDDLGKLAEQRKYALELGEPTFLPCFTNDAADCMLPCI